MTLSAALSALSTFSTAPLRRLRVPFPSRCDRNAILAMQQDIPLASPVTEVSVAFFDRLVGTERLKAFEGVVAGLTGVYAGEGGASGWASGWVGGGLPLKVAGAVGEGGGVGKVEGEGKGKAEGGDGLGDTEEEEAEMYKAYVSVLGWESVAQHYKFNETDAVKRNVGAIQAVGVREWEVWHVALRKVWDGGREGEH
ncbi:hypothetical protein MMC30_005008 [Trapelia coarctata]|nr:hypothetical protein [Trapelia coarctata]